MKNEQEERRQHQVEEWFTTNYQSISDQLHESVPIDRVEDLLIRFCQALSLCPARSEAQFIKWAGRWIESRAQPTPLDASDLDLNEALSAHKRQRKNTPPFPRYEQHGDKTYIQLIDAVGQIRPWIIPSEWLCVAQRLWPFHLRRYAGGSFYVAKKVPAERPDGRHEQVVVPLHRLFVETGGDRLVGDRKAKMVTATDGDYLNWTDGNLTTRQWTSRDVMDVRPHGSSIVVSLGTQTANLTLDNDILSAGSLPAKPTRPPGHGPNDSPDREEWICSGFYDALENDVADTPEGDVLDQPVANEEIMPIRAEVRPSQTNQQHNPLTKALCRTHGVQNVTDVSDHPDGMVVTLQCGCRRSEVT
jgi:hypothetical protein